MERYSDIHKATIAGIAGNIFLLIIKFIVGFLSKSQALIADAANSAGDIFASLMSYIGGKISRAPSDDSHNFGHGKAEYIFSLFISLSMIFIALKLIYDSVISLFNPKEISVPNLAIIVCIITITIKLILFVYTRFLSKRTDSILIKALKQDHRNDCIVTTFTLISIILSMFGIYWFDGIVGIGISILICITGIKLFIDSYDVLMDSSMDDETKQKILDIVKNYPSIQKINHLTSKPVGYKYLISISIYVDGNMSTFDSHQIADKLEKELNSLDSVYLSIIHVNPI
ncbi:cation diffusion facilitator family transporter [Clostridium sp. CAG:780]|nr:cation diffusion facilitator family transporter [Clostridium sp. CAG:780]